MGLHLDTTLEYRKLRWFDIFEQNDKELLTRSIFIHSDTIINEYALTNPCGIRS